jgi:hypothetical protein
VIVELQGIGICYTGTYMAKRNRNVTYLFLLNASMTAGVLVLMALDSPHPFAGAYSLPSYRQRDSAENVVKNTSTRTVSHWDRVEIYYNNTSGGNADELALLTDLENGAKDQFHFVIGNGNGAEDGTIQAGELWKLQRLCQGSYGLVRICVISDGRAESVTDCHVLVNRPSDRLKPRLWSKNRDSNFRIHLLAFCLIECNFMRFGWTLDL